MGDEAYDENELPAIEEYAPDKRTLVIRGGYCRDEVYIGICRTKDDLPGELIAVDGNALKRILRSMVIGTRTERAERAGRRNQRTMSSCSGPNGEAYLELTRSAAEHDLPVEVFSNITTAKYDLEAAVLRLHLAARALHAAKYADLGREETTEEVARCAISAGELLEEVRTWLASRRR